MSNQKVKGLGRLRYIEPTNFFLEKEGSLSDGINFPYEDYCMAVDLTIRQTNRYSCGWWNLSGDISEITYSSKNGTLSFFGGTKQGDDGYLTTNFTDISMVNPESNTAECLGISSINIDYDSWWYPQVTIKFVDVRGATVMQPAEKGYYNNREMGTASSIYKGLFSFPYPMFILKVKGFYGKGITYRLALHNTVYDFDSNSGNFNITASFIGYKFGIYTDMPMSFLGCAPYMEGGKEYWAQKIASGEFYFRDSNGNPSKPMCTIPDLKLKLSAAASNQDAISASAMEQEMINIDSKQIETIISLNDMFPFNDWKNIDGKDFGSTNYCFKVFSNIDEIDEFYSGVTEYVKAIKAYDDVYDKNMMLNLKILDTLSGTTEEYISKNPRLISYKPLMNNNDFVQLTINDKSLKDGYFNKKDTDRIIKLLKSQPDYNNLEKNLLSKTNDKEAIKNWLNTDRNGQTIFFVISYEINKDFSPIKLKEILENERKTIEKKSIEQRKIYKEKSALALEKALGFRPSIRNIYNLIFAHMDTFTHTFYASTKRIKDQLEGEKTKRAKTTFNIKDGYTDTENVKIKTSNGSVVENTNARSKYLPPYAAYYTDNNSGNAKGKVLTWLENIPNGGDLEEVSFINNLINGAETYFKKTKEVEDIIKQLNTSGSTGIDMSFTSENTPTPSVSNFIPSTIFDFAFKGKYENPYLEVKKRLSENADVIESEIITILGLRAAQYVNYTRGEKKGIFGGKTKNNSDVFGKIEAINLFKALGDDFTNGFIEFLSKYATNKSSKQKKIKNNFISSLTGGNSSFNENLLTNAPDLNRCLFSNSYDDFLEYDYDKGRSDYRMFPFYINGIKQLQSAYTTGDEIFKNQKFLPVMLNDVLYSDEENEVTSFVCYDSRDYLSNIYKTFEQEIEVAINNSNVINDTPSYGDRSGDSYNGLENKEKIISEYKNNISADELSEEQYYCGVLVHSDGFLKISENGDVINRKSKEEQNKYNIKYTTFDYTFDDKNPTSIFNNSLYYHQGDNIKAKAFLFLISSPVIGNEYGFLNENKNGRNLKSLLLREGAFYWYIDSFGKENGFKWPDIVSKMEFVNGTMVETEIKKRIIVKPTGDGFYWLPIFNDNSKINKGIDGNNFENYTYFKVGDKNGNFRKVSYLPLGFTPSRKKQLKKFFEEWVETSFKENEEALRNINFYSRNFNDLGNKFFNIVSEKKAPKWYNFNLTETMINNSSEIEVGGKKIAIDSVTKVLSDDRNYDNGLDVSFLLNTETQKSIELRQLQIFLRDLFLGVCTVFELYSTKDNKNVYSGEKRRIETVNSKIEYKNLKTMIKAEKKQLENVMGGFLTELYTIYNKAITDHKENKHMFYKNITTAIKTNPFKNTDLRLATYITIKNLYDKWLSFPPYGPEETWCLTKKKNSNSEFDNFIYVDTYYNDIGDKLLVNITKVSEWLSTIVPNSDITTSEGEMQYTGKSIYEFLTEVAQNCGGNLFAIPQRFAMSNNDGIKDMFTPFPLYSGWDEESTGYVFIYTYKPSQHLGDNGTNNVDMNGWSPDGDGIDLTDEEIVGSLFSNEKDAYTIPSFGVTFAKQNQSIFKNLQLTTGSMAVTEASIAATFNVAAKTSESPRESVLYGQDLYRIYSNYSYNCSVETMGNMQIMPMMYFQLNNVPFWRGAYQIIKVSHTIEAGNITTKFDGVRINRHAIPMADGAVVIEPVTGDEIIDGGTIESGTKITREPNPGSYVGNLSPSNFKWVNTSNNPNIISSIIDTYGKTTTNTSYQKHGMDELGDNPGSNTYKSKYFKNFDESELGFSPSKISEKNPIICLLPAHWYGDSTKGENSEIFKNEKSKGKSGEYTWSCRVIELIHKKLKDEGFLSYLARGPYPNKNERNATGRPAYDLVGRFGSRKVISIMVHWNGGGGSYWCGLMNGTEQTTRLDSVKLMECICEEANVIKNKFNEPLMNGSCSVRNYSGKYANDAGCMPNCAAACTENWFMDFNGKEGKKWLVSKDGINAIANLHVNGIKQYIKLLQNGPIQGIPNS